MIALLLACSGGTPSAERPSDPQIVTLGPAITEVALELAPAQVVGIDTTSAELPGARSLPKVGTPRSLSAEGVLSLGPTVVLGDATAGPPEVLDQIRAAGVEVVIVAHERSPEGVRAVVRGVAEAMEVEGDALIERFDASCATLPAPSGQRALFVYARGAGTMSVSGTETAADAMLGLAGLENAVTAYEGYKPLTPEAAVEADPDWVVFTTRGLEGVGGPDGVASIPGLAQLDAVQDGRIAQVDDFLLLAFGLGTCEGARTLAAGVAR
ncbi:MAG: ABC transporter substrate-binding protein [Myxococcota bacterium]